MCEVNHFPFRFCSVMPCKMIFVCVAGLACRRKKAYNRQQKLMAKFASKQKAFMAQAQDSEEGRGDCFSVVFRDTLLHTGMFPSQPFYFFFPPHASCDSHTTQPDESVCDSHTTQSNESLTL